MTLSSVVILKLGSDAVSFASVQTPLELTDALHIDDDSSKSTPVMSHPESPPVPPPPPVAGLLSTSWSHGVAPSHGTRLKS